MGMLRRVCRNMKYSRSPSALRWTGAAMQEAAKGFHRLKAHKQLPMLKVAFAERKVRAASANRILDQARKVGQQIASKLATPAAQFSTTNGTLGVGCDGESVHSVRLRRDL